MESKCSMYTCMWDGFSDHRKACSNAIYTVHVRTLNL